MLSFEALINQYTSKCHSGLVVIDESLNVTQLRPVPGWLALTNRFDQHTELLRRDWTSHFSDFVWPDTQTFDCVIFRVSKERAVVHHLINQAANHLPAGSRLMLLGQKSEGIKTYAKNGQKRLGGERHEKKLEGESWVIELTRGPQVGEPLDDQKYDQIREVGQVCEHSLLSKPGVYGWKKIDKGSWQLINRLPHMLKSELPLGALQLLDLGSGSGYLALATSGPTTEVTCTDNNAAAQLATLATLEGAGFKAQFVFSNAGEELNSEFDLILCNPPFHSGFGIDYDLTDRFSKSASRLLKREGKACFVVNQHVPLKRIASNYFNSVELDQDSGNFCTYVLTQPRLQKPQS